jgi:hypothetical protein
MYCLLVHNLHEEGNVGFRHDDGAGGNKRYVKVKSSDADGIRTHANEDNGLNVAP